MNLQLLSLLHRFSLRAWLAAGLHSVVAMVLVVAAAAWLMQERFDRAVHKLLDIDGRISALSLGSNVAMLEARRAEKDFLIYRREFGFPEAKSRYVTLLRTSLAEIRHNMAEIRTLTADPETHEQSWAIDRALTQYEAGFLAIVELYGALGHSASGIEGHLRAKAREIESIVRMSGQDRLIAGLLSLRRHEKDFILRGLDRDAEAFAQGVAQLKADIASARLSGERREELARLANEYLGLFGQYVQTDNRINEEETKYLTAAHTVEPVLEKLRIDAHRGEVATRGGAERIGRIATWTISILALFSLFFGFAVARLVARIITHSLDECLQFAKRVTQGNLAARLAPKGQHEFGRLAAALNEMTTALQAREAGLQQAEAMAKLAHVIARPDGSFESWSDTLPRLIGAPAGAVPASSRAWLEMVHADDREQVRRKCIEAGRTSLRTEIEYRLRQSDGTWVDIRQWLEPLSGDADAGSRARWFNTLQDVTEHKRAGERLRESEERYRDLVENSSDLVCTHDLEGNFLSVNEAGARLSGHSRDALLRMNVADLLATEVRGSFAAYLAEIKRRGSATGLMRVQTAGGELRWWEYHNTLRTEGVAVPIVRGTSHDVTERMRAEIALRESEAKLRAIFANAVEGIFLVDGEGRVVSANPRLAHMLGYETPEKMGREIGSVAREVYADKGARGRFRKQLETHRVVEDFETRWRRKDGSIFWVSISGRVIERETGGAIHHLGMARDITERKRAEAKIRRLNRVYAVLSGINALIVRVRDRKELLRGACEIAVQAGGFKSACAGIVDPERADLQVIAHAGVRAEFRPTIGAQGVVQRALDERVLQVVNDASDIQGPLGQSETLPGYKSFAVLPLLVNGEPVGVLSLLSDEAGFFDDEEMKLLRDLGGDLAFALENIAQSQRLNHLAYYDPLTDLANRSLFQERLGQFIAGSNQGGGRFALVLADVERLKAVNDSLGRQAGDELLRQLGKRLANATAPVRLARVSADQFALILPEVRGKNDAGRQLEEIVRQCLAQPFKLDCTEVRASVRSGIALYPSHGDGAEPLLRNAEAALRKAKETGERYAFYTTDLTERVSATLTLENQLRQALERNEFVLHYQPKVDLASGHVTGVEALIRWSSPELGLVPPSEFVPLLESTGLIQEAGTWALQTAVRDHHRWQRLGLDAPRVAVNVSPLQLRRRDFVATIKQALAQGADCAGIDLELTESLLMHDVEGNIEKLRLLRDLGLAIAIDDFGTGYSSLAYLAKLPVHSIKIDRSFIITMLDDPNTMTLVSTMISLAHSLRLKVVAEGVDSEEQAKFLRLLRCDEIQGYLFSKPVPFEQITALLRTSAPALERAYA